MPRKTRTTRYQRYGIWAQHSQQVADLVHQGLGVSEAVRRVVRKNGYPDFIKAFNGIRAAFYEAIKRKARKEFEI